MSSSALIIGFMACGNACVLDLNKLKTYTMDANIFITNTDDNVISLLALVHCYNPPPIPTGDELFSVHFVVGHIASVCGGGDVSGNCNLNQYNVEIDAIVVHAFDIYPFYKHYHHYLRSYLFLTV